MKAINWLNGLYGSEEKNKMSLGAGKVFGMISLLMILANYFSDVDIITKSVTIYISAVLVSCTLFMFGSYFFTKRENSDKCKVVKYSIFILSLILITVVFLPVILVGFLSERIKFQNLIKHGDKYVITVFIPWIFALFVGGHIYIALWEVSWLNASTISMLIAFMIWRCGSIGLLKVCHKFGKYRLSESDYLAIKKDLYVIVFAMITFFTIVANCVSFKDIEKEMIDGVTKAFAIYIAVDRLLGKWKSANSDFEKDMERLKEEEIVK